MRNGCVGFDTNILVYALDKTAGDKHEASARLVREVSEGKRRGAVTSQVLAELVSVLRTKVRRAATDEDILAAIGGIAHSPHWVVCNYTAKTVMRAAQLGGHFWDALIAETLREHGVQELLTEKVKDFDGLGLKAHNPFAGQA